MKVTCLLTSYNRPNWVRHALKSVADQSHKDYELVVLDESTVFDISAAVAEFSFTEVVVRQFKVSAEERKNQTRLSVNINRALPVIKGDLVCFLSDDDYYYPNWFRDASAFFESNPTKMVGFGKLVYSSAREMVFPSSGRMRFFNGPMSNPFTNLDHNQVIHRRFEKPYHWPEDPGSMSAPDGLYFQSIAKDHVFHPIHAFAAVKRSHPKALQLNIKAIREGSAEEVRE